MKHITLATTALLALSTALNAATLKLNFEDLDNYTDFSLQGLSEEKTKNIFVKEVKRSLRLKKIVGEDRKLEITFDNIDMAGDIQPWRNRQNSDIRYVEGIYPPSMDFKYTLRDPSGAIVAEGEESIKDLNFDFGITSIGNSHFKYEMTLLEDWARQTLKSSE
jgi:DNA polymerase III delta prime subunit|tara:strand:+ start:283 stop:771 length:489 start_codon:yes stop_codon:yes gene_type:complete